MREWKGFSTLVLLFMTIVFGGCSGGGNGGADSQTGPDPPPATGDTPIQLDTLNQLADLHVLTVNRAGDHAVIWEARDMTGDQLWVTPRQTGGAWGPPQIWAEVDSIGRPDVLAALRETQQSVLVWDEGSFTFAQVQPRADGGIPSLLVEGGELTRLALAATMDEPVVVLWRESGTLQTSTYTTGGLWTLPEPVPLLSAAELAVDPDSVAPVPVQTEIGASADGSRIVVWRNFADMRAIRWLPSQGWEEPIVLRETDTLIGDFALSVSANGTAVVLWCERSATGPRDLMARHFTGSVWTPAVLVALARCPARSPNLQVKLDDTGDGVVAWETGSVNAARLRAGQWEPPQVLTESGRNMQLSVHPSGVAAVVWLEGSVLEAPQLRLIMQGFLDSSTEWIPPRLLAERFELIGSIKLRVATDPDGRVQVVWDTELGELWSLSAVIEQQ